MAEKVKKFEEKIFKQEGEEREKRKRVEEIRRTREAEERERKKKSMKNGENITPGSEFGIDKITRD